MRPSWRSIAARHRAGRQDRLRGSDLRLDRPQRGADRTPQRSLSLPTRDGIDCRTISSASAPSSIRRSLFLMPAPAEPDRCDDAGRTPPRDRRDRAQAQGLDHRGRGLRRCSSAMTGPPLADAGAGPRLPCRRPVEGRGRGRARRLGRLPAEFRAARLHRPQDGDRRQAVPDLGTRRAAGPVRRTPTMPYSEALGRDREPRGASRARCFAGLDIRLDERVPFLWLNLPEPWLSSTFKSGRGGGGHPHRRRGRVQAGALRHGLPRRADRLFRVPDTEPGRRRASARCAGCSTTASAAYDTYN